MMNLNVKDGLLAAGGGAVAAGLVGLTLKAGAFNPSPKPGQSLESYEAQLLYTSGAFFAVLGGIGLYTGNPQLRAASLGALGLAGAGLLSGIFVSTMSSTMTSPGASSQTSGAMMGVRAPAVMQMDAALNHKKAPATTWINTTTGKRW